MQTKASMLVVGLANSGKTSIVQALKAEQSLDDTVPTVGFSVERFHMLNTMLTVVDMSGQPKYQKLWECYYDDVQVRMSLSHLSLVACIALHLADSSCCMHSPERFECLHPEGTTHCSTCSKGARDTTAATWWLWCSLCPTAKEPTRGRTGMQASPAAQRCCLHGTALCQFQLPTWAKVNLA